MIDKILLTDSLEFNGTIHELKEKIRFNRERKFDFEWIELYFITFVFSFIFFCGYMSGEEFPLWVYLLQPISLIWFWFVLRVQEKRLFKNFKTYIDQI